MQSGGIRTQSIKNISKRGIPLITVITVVYNDEKNLEGTILSVINQSYSNIEYIIIDGASTDNTLEIIKKYENKITYWISEPDDGIYYAMNKGIDLATGEWINFMNSGDTFYNEDVIELIFKKNFKDDIIYGDTYMAYTVSFFIEKAKTLDSMLKRMPFGHQSVFIKTSLMKEKKYDVMFRSSSDYNFFYKSFKENKIFCYIPVIIAKYNAEYGMSHNFKLVQRENARIQGIDETIKWRIIYLLKCSIYEIKKLIKRLLPICVVEKIKKNTIKKLQYANLGKYK